jgi:hypothetical protein
VNLKTRRKPKDQPLPAKSDKLRQTNVRKGLFEDGIDDLWYIDL